MKINTKITLAFLAIALVPFVVAGVFSFARARAILEEEILEHLTSVAAIQKHRVNGIVSRNRERLKLVASRTQLRLSLEKYIADPQDVHVEKMNRILRDARSSIPDFRSISVVSLGSIVVASTEPSRIGTADDGPGMDGAYLRAFHVPERFYLGADGKLAMCLRGPLILDETLLGTVLIEASADSFVQMMQDFSGLRATGETMLAQAVPEGARSITPLRFDARAALALTTPRGHSRAPMVRALLGQEGLHRDTVDYRGEPVLAATAYFPDSGWGLVVKMDKAEAFLPAFRLRTVLLRMFVMTLLVVVIAAPMLARTISLPIVRLTGVAERIEDGELGLRADDSTGGETGVLAEAFNRMTADLVDANAYLEQRVRERTGELEHEVGQRRKAEEELRRAKEAAEAANRAKSTFLANMSHELRTPLNAVIGYSEMLEEDARDEGMERFVPDLERIRAAGLHLLGLINEVLDLSKIEAGKIAINLEGFSVAAMVRDVASTVKPLVEKRGNRIEVHCAGNVGEMHSDVVRVRQVLLNLLSNAAKFTEKGRIVLSANREKGDSGDALVFRISDTGIGMTPEQAARVFEPFVQADTSTSREYGGTGLGLAICRRLCQTLGGDIAVDSCPGKGSTFTVKIAAAMSLPELPGPRGRGAAAGGAPGGATVLVIDDDPAARDLMGRILEKEGFGVLVAGSGEEGLSMARECAPTAITLDVMMPKMDGWSVLSVLKSDPELARIPVVMVTIVDDREMGYALGAADYLVKPVDRDLLAETIGRYRRDAESFSVLTVDDDSATREFARWALEKLGCKVIEAESGEAGLDLLRASRADLILLDLMMPGMDGFEFIEELRHHDAWRAIPVVVLTGKALSDDDHSRLNGYVATVVQKGAKRQNELAEEIVRLVKMHSPPGTV